MSAEPDLRQAAAAAAEPAAAAADDAVVPARARHARSRARPRPPEGRRTAEPAAALDDVDRRLLRILQVDGRITNLKLAAAVGLSSASTHGRVRRLVRDGTILGFGARLNPTLLQAGMLVFAEVRLADMSNEVNAAFKAAVQLRPEILECHEVAGGFDYLLKTRVAHMGAYRDLVAAVAWSLPGVRDVRTFAVMEELKNTSALPLPAA
ncbi:MAG TPA: Lrp/AsnC ligand binding domain-containing protein [Burkholderiaceae bacterium]